MKTFFRHTVTLGILGCFLYAMISNDIQRRVTRIQKLGESSESLLLQEIQDLTPSKADKVIQGEDYTMKGNAIWNGTLICPYQSTDNNTAYMRLKNFFTEETMWQEDVYNIFLTETSCDSKPSYRVWCSVESMAQQNPHALVWYVMTSQEVDVSDGLVQRLLQQYQNLKIVTINLKQVFSGTPLEELYNSVAWHKDTEWPASHLCDMIRAAIVWHAGGFYSDTDAICIAPLTSLRNVIGLAGFNMMGYAAYHFERHHPILHQLMAYIDKNFDPYIWGKNGPQAVSAVLRSVCGADELLTGMECDGVKILPIEAFYPIPSFGIKNLFQRSREKDMNKKFPNSYTIHIWNKMSHDNPVIKNSGVLYDLASAVFCPNSREVATQLSSLY